MGMDPYPSEYWIQHNFGKNDWHILIYYQYKDSSLQCIFKQKFLCNLRKTWTIHKETKWCHIYHKNSWKGVVDKLKDYKFRTSQCTTYLAEVIKRVFHSQSSTNIQINLCSKATNWSQKRATIFSKFKAKLHFIKQQCMSWWHSIKDNVCC